MCLLAFVVHRSFFFFNDTATTEIYTLSLHDALPILMMGSSQVLCRPGNSCTKTRIDLDSAGSRVISGPRSEEHTSELQSQSNLVCRLLLAKKSRSGSKITDTAVHTLGSLTEHLTIAH